MQFVNADAVEQYTLRLDHILDGDHRKFQAVPPLARIHLRHRAGRPVATSDHIDTDDEKFRRVDRLPVADETVPPAGFPVSLVKAGGMMASAEGMGDEHGVVSLFIEFAVGFVHQLVGLQYPSAFEIERIGKELLFRLDFQRLTFIFIPTPVKPVPDRDLRSDRRHLLVRC